MKNLIIYFFSIILVSSCKVKDDCNCEQELKQLILKVESEYPGFKDKTKDTLVYENYKENLLITVQDVEEPDCIELLRSYISFFRDGHLSIKPSKTRRNTEQSLNSDDTIAISQSEFEKYLSTTDDPLEGIWRSDSYKVGLIKRNNEYLGFVLEADTNFWKANEIKFRLDEDGKADYYLKDHSLSKEAYELEDGWILYFNYSKFYKEFPAPHLSDIEIQARKNEIEGFYFKKVSEKTSLLCLSSFEHNYIDRIRKLLEDNRNEIEKSENLIIDVRNNLGGAFNAYEGLFPYILTNDIRGVGMEFLATQTLIDNISDWYEDEDGKRAAENWKVIFKEHLGEFVNTDAHDVYITSFIPAEHSPGQVVILVNRRTASSAEAFVLDAKQSKKVKIMGTPTYGALDYGSVSEFDFGCNNYKLMMPTWRSMRLPDYPIDNIGIQPDIYLDKHVNDWVQFAVDYLEDN